MKHFEHVFRFVRKVVWQLVINGLIAIAVGVLIFVYPELLAYLVAAILVFLGLSSLIMAIRVNRYSRIELDFD